MLGQINALIIFPVFVISASGDRLQICDSGSELFWVGPHVDFIEAKLVQTFAIDGKVFRALIVSKKTVHIGNRFELECFARFNRLFLD